MPLLIVLLNIRPDTLKNKVVGVEEGIVVERLAPSYKLENDWFDIFTGNPVFG